MPAQNQPLHAIPVRLPDTEARTDSQGQLHLRRPIAVRGPLDAWFRRILRLDTHVHLQLDKNGAAFWALVDGRDNLTKIATRLAESLQMEISAAQDAVVLFTKMLMTRRFLAIQIPNAKP
ncbi:MAG: PqqD family protein [Spartobacteria bacterium]